MGDILVRDIVLIATELTPALEEYNSYIADENYYEAGVSFGGMWKMFFDSTIQE